MNTHAAAQLGRWFYAFALFASGAQQVLTAKFVRLVPAWPAWVPWPWLWAELTGIVLIAAGLALALDRRERDDRGAPARAGALAAGALLLALFLFLGLPNALSNPLTGFMWTNPCKMLALLAGAILLAGNLPASLLALASLFLGLFLLICGVQHFVYADFVDTLVPAWIPPGRRFWTCLTGVALIAGGLGIFLPRTRRLAAGWVALMVFLWVLLLHIPRAVATRSVFELDGVFEALAISGVGLRVFGAPAGRRAG